jgi:heme/copper-type cytochrome/quinol oxidase subunit 2
MPRALRHSRAALLLMLGVCIAAVTGAALTAAGQRAPRAIDPTPPPAVVGQEGGGVPQPREWHIVARKYAFSEPTIEVQQDDLVKITLETADIPHSFTIDEPYRIAKRARPGHPVVFEFRADKVGTFEFYCNLKTDDGCRAMKGKLVVLAKR